jgi:hypothetical protein
MMKKLIFLILLLSLSTLAQVKFDIKDAPGLYNASIKVEECDEHRYCTGDATFTLFKKRQSGVFQTFKFKTEFGLWDEDQWPGRLPYKKQGTVLFADYNFDGVLDLALQNGTESGYGGSSYNVYLYSRKAKKFVFNRKFSDLATAPYLGLFSVDRKKKVLRTDQKSGCCMHEVQEYRVINNRPVMIYSVYEESMNGEYVVTTIKRLVKGKWRTSVVKEKIKNR